MLGGRTSGKLLMAVVYYSGGAILLCLCVCVCVRVVFCIRAVKLTDWLLLKVTNWPAGLGGRGSMRFIFAEHLCYTLHLYSTSSPVTSSDIRLIVQLLADPISWIITGKALSQTDTETRTKSAANW